MSTNTNAISFSSWQLHLTSSSMWYFDYGDGRRLSSMCKILWTFISNLKYKVFWLLCHSCAETVLLAKSALRSILQIRTKEITYLLLIKRRLNSSFHMMQSHLSSKSTQELYFTSFFYILCDGKCSPFQNASCSLTYQISLLLCIVYWCRPFFWDAV